MKYIAKSPIYILATLASVYSLPDEACNRIKVGEHWYDREVIWSNFGRPYNLYTHRSSNTLFFTYTLPELYSDTDFQIAFYNLDSKEYQTIAGIKGGCSVAIDQNNDDIFLGGSDGIFKYNMLTRIADFYKEKETNIWSLYFKKNLFYISYPDQRLHIEIDGKFAAVKEFEHFEIDQFHINNNGDIFFANKSGLFSYDKAAVTVVNDLVTVRQFTEDNQGDMYICTSIGVFADGKFEELTKIIDFKNIYGITFDRDNNLIYSDEKSIIRLIHSIVGCDNKSSRW